jgi:tetratricopeptide (TPR) repeat protein
LKYNHREMKILREISLCLLLFGPLAAQEQVVEVTSDPPGALVVVDHLVRGKTPLTITELQPGQHHFRVSFGPGYHPFLQDLEIKPSHSESCHVVLSPVTETSLNEGVRLLKEGKVAEAEVALHRALRELPKQPEAFWWLGRLAYERQQDEQAVRHLRQYAQYFPTESRVHLLLGELHKRGGRPNASYTSYKLALLNSVEMGHALEDVPPATWEAIRAAGEPVAPIEQMRLAYLYEMKGRIPEALQWMERAVNELYSDRKLRPLQ